MDLLKVMLPITASLLALPKTRINYPLIQKQKDWIRRGCAKWFYNISAMPVMKVPSEIVYTNISKMCFRKTRRKNNNYDYWEICLRL